MGRMKDWMMDMEDCAITAIEMGASSTSSVVAHCRTHMGLVDEKYIERYIEEVMGPGDDRPATMTGPGTPGY